MSLMTIDQAYTLAMNQHPSLYIASTPELSKIKFYDHVFNCIGNSISTLEDFEEHYTIAPHNENLIHTIPEKYTSGEQLYYAYTDTNFPNFNNGINGLFTLAEIEQMPECKRYTPVSKLNIRHHVEFVPHPNFSEEYSFVYRFDLTKIGRSWTTAALEYYRYCKKFFTTPDAQYYSGAVPSDLTARQRSIDSYEKCFARYKQAGMTEAEYHKAISEAYELEYTGDILDFMARRWNIELDRINKFIDATITKLES